MTTQDTIVRKSAALLGAFRGSWSELRTNWRALFGLAVIAALIGGYGLLRLEKAVGELRTAYREAVHRRERVVPSGGAKDWLARATASTRMRKTIEQRLWKADSEGMASANLQDWVTTAARASGLQRLQVKVELVKPKGMEPDLRQVTATITAQQTEASLMAFLARVYREPHLLVVDRLHVRLMPIPSLEMRLLGFVRVPSTSNPRASR
jgi:Type II secretion system (T2SS), protein M subtype b